MSTVRDAGTRPLLAIDGARDAVCTGLPAAAWAQAICHAVRAGVAEQRARRVTLSERSFCSASGACLLERVYGA